MSNMEYNTINGALFISCGLPGSGKTTWLMKNFDAPKDNKIVISRDNIRFDLLKPGEDYFSHEDEVFDEFVNRITWHINNGFDVVADATHLNKGSRLKLLAALTIAGCHPRFVAAVYFSTPLEICLKRNEQRKGTKFYVSKNTIRNMANKYHPPTRSNFYKNVYEIDENGELSFAV